MSETEAKLALKFKDIDIPLYDISEVLIPVCECGYEFREGINSEYCPSCGKKLPEIDSCNLPIEKRVNSYNRYLWLVLGMIIDYVVANFLLK